MERISVARSAPPHFAGGAPEPLDERAWVAVLGEAGRLDVLDDRVQDVARRLGATAWVGDRSLTPAEALWRTGDGPVSDDQRPRR